MSVLQSGITKSLAKAYTIDQSLRFDDGDSDYLSRTQTAGNRKTWTWSCWAKRCLFGNTQDLFGTASEGDGLRWYGAASNLNFLLNGSGSGWLVTDAEYRDVSAWYHIVVAFDTTESVDSDRIKLWVNGVQQTDFSGSNYPAEDSEFKINQSGEVFYIGRGHGEANILDCYLAEIYFIDGTAYDADDFGETDSETNQWKPIDASGLTFGTNGFYLKFEDSADLGNDSSGEGNDYTVTNLAATDQVLDSPTNNFMTINSLAGGNGSGGGQTLSEGNLQDAFQVDDSGIGCTFQLPSSGKWYWEWYNNVQYNTNFLGIYAPDICSPSDSNPADEGFWVVSSTNGSMYGGGGIASYGSGWGTVDNIIGLAADMDNGALYLATNNTWDDSGDPESGASKTGAGATDLVSSGYDWVPMLKTHNPGGAAKLNLNAGQDSSFAGSKTAQGNTDANGIGDFYYAPPSGYLALCTRNLPDPEIKLPGDNFNTVLYTGDGATTLAVTGVGFQPEFTWIKNRSANDKHVLVDALRGATKYLRSDYISAEVDDSTFVASLDSDGFTVGNDVVVNTNTENYVAWNWLSATSNAANEDGSVSSVVRANTEAGFSIVSYTGTGSAGASVGHGLSAAPNLIIVKKLSAEGSWMVWSSSLTGGNEEDRYIYLNLTNAQATSTDYWGAGITSSTFGVWQHGGDNNTTGANFIAYCFHSVEGYSKIGSYTGNGNANGAFVYTGFRPAYVMLKHTNSGDSWPIADKLRGGEYNGNIARLRANTTGVEDDNNRIDILSNGFKITVDYAESNADAGTYMYYAVAEYPFKYANAR